MNNSEIMRKYLSVLTESNLGNQQELDEATPFGWWSDKRTKWGYMLDKYARDGKINVGKAANAKYIDWRKYLSSLAKSEKEANFGDLWYYLIAEYKEQWVFNLIVNKLLPMPEYRILLQGNKPNQIKPTGQNIKDMANSEIPLNNARANAKFFYELMIAVKRSRNPDEILKNPSTNIQKNNSTNKTNTSASFPKQAPVKQKISNRVQQIDTLAAKLTPNERAGLIARLMQMNQNSSTP